MPKFAAVLPTPETVGDFEEMCLAAGESAGLVHEIKPAGQIVSEMMTEAERVIVARLVSLVSYRIVYLGTVRNPESFTTTLDDDNNGYDHQPTSLAHRVGNFETPHSRGYSINSIGKAKALTRAATKSAAASGLRLKSF